MMNNLPIYKAVIDNYNEGITAISFVQEPAVETHFMQFSKNKKSMKFNILDNTNKKVIAPIMRCDFPIYRYDEQLGEYYVVYTKDVIEVMARKMLADNLAKNMNMEHNPYRPMEGVYLEQIFIKNIDKGINPKGFEDIEEYSLFGVYTIDNEDVWNSIQDGTFNGISLEGYFTFDLEEDEEVKEWEEVLSLLKKCLKQNIK